jgi:predicted transcriptional regulator
MATCKYCGQSAGFFSRVHKECEEKHEKGIQGMSGMLRKYFSGAMTAQDMGAKIQRNRLPYYLSDEDIADVAASVITDYASTLHRPWRISVFHTH